MAESKTDETNLESKRADLMSPSGYLSESDDDFNYEEIPESDEDDDVAFIHQEDTLASIEKSLQRAEQLNSPVNRRLTSQQRSKQQDVQTIIRPSVVDDFIRNFFAKMKMNKALDAFNTEWYEMKAKGKLRDEDVCTVPDIYLRNEELDQQVKILREELEKMKVVAEKAQSTWDKFKKERDFHRMHHKRVVQEKNRLVTDIKRLKKHFAAYEPTLAELKNKYELAMKEKMLMRLERDRLQLKTAALEQQILTIEQGATPQIEDAPSVEEEANAAKQQARRRRKKNGDSVIPEIEGHNPHLNGQTPEAVQASNFQMVKTFKGHVNSVSAVAYHPKKSIIATASDDVTWKLWAMPNAELIMSGEGHSSWVSGLDFNPRGSHLATSSGDGTVKLWDFAKAKCSGTFKDHTQAVWDVAYHWTGDFVASCSMDHTAKLLDVNTMKLRQTFRGHVDSINAIVFQPYTNNICTASGDKTVSLWDIRSGLCIQTFYGHTNACNSVAFSQRGDSIASCDSDGVVKVWDVRMIAERSSMSDNQHALNSVSFDPSGKVLACASDDGTVKMFDLEGDDGGHLVCNLTGHDDAVQVAKFGPTGNLITGGSDCTFRLWKA